MDVRDLRLLIAPLQRKVQLMLARAVLTLIDDAHGLQLLQAVVNKGDLWDGVQRIQEYGFTSVPLPGAEAVIVAIGGLRANGVALAVDDRRYRLQGLPGGAVALYDDRGQIVYLRRDGMHLKAVGKLRLEGDTVEIVAHTTRRDDVGGYATEMIYEGGDAWTQNTWQEGAVVTVNPHPVAPPQEWPAF